MSLENGDSRLFWMICFFRLAAIGLLWFSISRTHLVLEPRASFGAALAIVLILVLCVLAIIAAAAIPIIPLRDLISNGVTRQFGYWSGTSLLSISAVSILGLTKALGGNGRRLLPVERWRMLWNAIGLGSVGLGLLLYLVFARDPLFGAILLGTPLFISTALSGYVMPRTLTEIDDF